MNKVPKNVIELGKKANGFLGTLSALITIFLFYKHITSEVTRWLGIPVLYYAIIGVLVTMIFLLILYIGRSISVREKVFIVISPFADAAFFTSLIQKIVMDLEVHFGFDVVIRIPDPHDPESLQRTLVSIKECKKDYVGGIIIPGEQCREDLIEKFSKEFEKAIVLVDRNPFKDEKAFPPNMVYVGYESQKGGELAAKAMKKMLDHRKLDKPTILVLGSNEQTERQKSFTERMRNLGFDDRKILIDNNGGFNRKKAKAIMKKFLQKQTKIGDHSAKAIFCTNDEMALGVNDEIQNNFILSYKDFVIIGYDGISEAKEIIDRGGTAFMNTIIQSPVDLGAKAASILNKTLCGENSEKSIFLSLKLYKI